MTGDAYQKLAAKTMPNPEDKIASGLHGVLGLISIKSEYFEAFYNFMDCSIECDDEYFKELLIRLKKVAGDIWWFIAEIATANDLYISEILADRKNFLRTEDPYGGLAGIYQMYFQGQEIDKKAVRALLADIIQNLYFVSMRYFIYVEDVWEFNIKELEKNIRI